MQMHVVAQDPLPASSPPGSPGAVPEEQRRQRAARCPVGVLTSGDGRSGWACDPVVAGRGRLPGLPPVVRRLHPDSDNDGLPDAWELENFGNLDRTGSGNFDSDNLTDREEYIVGSNPKDAASGFPALAVESTGETFRVTFPTIAGRVYTVMGRASLTSDQWTPVTNVQNGQPNPVEGDGTTKTVTETGLGTTAARFYRVQVELISN